MQEKKRFPVFHFFVKQMLLDFNAKKNSKFKFSLASGQRCVLKDLKLDPEFLSKLIPGDLNTCIHMYSIWCAYMYTSICVNTSGCVLFFSIASVCNNDGGARMLICECGSLLSSSETTLTNLFFPPRSHTHTHTFSLSLSLSFFLFPSLSLSRTLSRFLSHSRSFSSLACSFACVRYHSLSSPPRNARQAFPLKSKVASSIKYVCL